MKKIIIKIVKVFLFFASIGLINSQTSKWILKLSKLQGGDLNMSQCPKCQSEISFMATKCPRCTSDIKSGWEKGISDWLILFKAGAFLVVLLLAFVVLFIIWLLIKELFLFVIFLIDYPSVQIAKLFGYDFTPEWWLTIISLGIEVGLVFFAINYFKNNKNKINKFEDRNKPSE